MDILLVLLVAVLPILPFVVIFVVVRYGPIRNPWWRGEHPLGVATLAGFIGAFLGAIGAMLIWPSSNLGPPVGMVVAAPIAFLAGLVWGFIRARRGNNA